MSPNPGYCRAHQRTADDLCSPLMCSTVPWILDLVTFYSYISVLVNDHQPNHLSYHAYSVGIHC